MKYVNLTPHAITLHTPSGEVSFPPSGSVARVSVEMVHDTTVPVPIVADPSLPSDFLAAPVFSQRYGAVENLPDPCPEFSTIYIVSGLVLAACSDRHDVFAPATGHKDVKRNEKGHIVSVPGFVR